MDIKKINYKSDFLVTLQSDTGWTTPFCIRFWTNVPTQCYCVCYDGKTYTRCRQDDDPTKLVVLFDDHGLGTGILKMQMAWHAKTDEFPSVIMDEVMNQMEVIVDDEGTEKQVELALEGETSPEILFNLPAYANEQQRIQNELQRQQNEADRIAAELQREQATAAAVQGAENVNAQLNGTTLTVTNRNGVSTSVNTKGEQGEQGPEGPQGQKGVSVTGLVKTGETETDTLYNVTFSDGSTQAVSIPKGAKGDTGSTGPTGPQGPQGQTGVSITGMVETVETTTATLYNITFSNGTTQQVAIPKGKKGDTGDQGPVGPQGPQGPMGDVAVITPEQQAAFTMYSEPGQNTNGPMTQKAVSDMVQSKITETNYGQKITFEQGLPSGSTGQIVYADDNVVTSFINGGVTVKVNSGYFIRYVSRYNLNQSYVDRDSEDLTRKSVYLPEGYLYRLTIQNDNRTVIRPDDDILSISVIKNRVDELESQQYIFENIIINNYIYSGWTTDSRKKWLTGTSCIIIPVKSADFVRITANNNYNAQYVFLKTCCPVSNKLLDVSNGSTLTIVYAGETVDITIPNDAAFMFMLTTLNNTDRIPSSVLLCTRTKEVITQDNPAIYNDIVSDDKWIVNHAYLSITNKKFAVNNYTYLKYLKVNEGDNFTIIADKGYACEWATLKSIPDLITNLYLSNAVRCGVVNSGDKINITINGGETILLLNLNTSQYTYDATVRYSSNHWESGEIPVVCIPVYGQSLAVGGDAPRITNKAKFPLITFNTELLINDFSQTQETAKFGLLDSYVESLCIDRCIGQGNVGSSIMSFSFGQGSRSITLLKKGTTLYTQFLAKIQAAYDIVGSSLVVPAFCWIQGEDDRFGTYTDDYKGELLQLRADLDADIKAITGQTQDVHCIVYQTNQLSIGDVTPGHFVPDSYNSGDYGGLMTVPTAQYELIRDNPYFHAATPIYYMKFAVSANGRTIHINSESQKVMGFYCGLAAERVTEGLADIGLYVQSVTKIDSTHIQLTLHTPCPPIVIDTQQVYEVDGYGFSVITPNNTNILQSVEVKPNHWSEQVINITTSEDCTNAKVRYGCNGVIAGDSDGYARGSRGNIRDSQGLQYFATVNGKQIPMHNWLYFGEWLIP